MARLFGCFALLISAAVLAPTWAQEKKDDKKDPAKAAKDAQKDKAKEPAKGDDDPKKTDKDKKTEKPKEAPEEKVVYGQVLKAKLKRMDANSAREFTIEIPTIDKKKVLELEIWKQQQLADIARQAPQNQRNRIAQYNNELAQKSIYSLFDKDVRAADNMKVRSSFPPVVYDDRGNLKQWKAKELAALRGKSKLPGYPADFDALRPGQFVEVYMAKTKAPATTKGKGIKLDDEDLRDRPEVVMILILQEAPKGGGR
jgi:hypothetical protein